MDHRMGLFEEPFHSMKTGEKTVEVRLNDEKRRKVKIGDFITFIRLPENGHALVAEVTELRTFPTFREMYEHIPASDFDAVGDSIEEMVTNTYELYTPEQEKAWGTSAITLKLVKEE